MIEICWCQCSKNKTNLSFPLLQKSEKNSEIYLVPLQAYEDKREEKKNNKKI